MENVGFLGLGIMGSAMARNLIGAGYRVCERCWTIWLRCGCTDVTLTGRPSRDGATGVASAFLGASSRGRGTGTQGKPPGTRHWVNPTRHKTSPRVGL